MLLWFSFKQLRYVLVVMNRFKGKVKQYDGQNITRQTEDKPFLQWESIRPNENSNITQLHL